MAKAQQVKEVLERYETVLFGHAGVMSVGFVTTGRTVSIIVGVESEEARRELESRYRGMIENVPIDFKVKISD